MPTPEEIRQDDQTGWREVKAATGDKLHTFKIKTVNRVRSKISGKPSAIPEHVFIHAEHPARCHFGKKMNLKLRK
jgi:hypothetical protein